MKAQRSLFPFSALICLAMLGGCSTFDNASADLAKQNETALLRQQFDSEQTAPNNQQVHLDMIRKMQDQSLYFASLAHFEAYLKLYGPSPEVLRLQADALRATGQTEEAEKQYQKLLETPEAASAWRGLGLLSAQRDDYANAIEHLRKAAQHDPTNALILSDLGYAYLRGRQTHAARLPLLQAAELTPTNRKVISNLALFLMLSGDMKKAEAMMDQANIPESVRTAIHKQMESIARHDVQFVAPDAALSNTNTLAHSNGMRLQLELRLPQENRSLQTN